MPRLLAERPWLLVVLAFLLLAGAWAALIVIAKRNEPDAIPLPPPGIRQEAGPS